MRLWHLTFEALARVISVVSSRCVVYAALSLEQYLVLVHWTLMKTRLVQLCGPVMHDDNLIHGPAMNHLWRAHQLYCNSNEVNVVFLLSYKTYQAVSSIIQFVHRHLNLCPLVNLYCSRFSIYRRPEQGPLHIQYLALGRLHRKGDGVGRELVHLQNGEEVEADAVLSCDGDDVIAVADDDVEVEVVAVVAADGNRCGCSTLMDLDRIVLRSRCLLRSSSGGRRLSRRPLCASPFT